MPPIRRRTNAVSIYRLQVDILWNIRADYTVWKHHRMSAKSPARSAAQGVPPSPPRLPSPPPLPELQLGPRSPAINSSGGELSLDNTASQDEGAARRIRPGTKASDMARGPPFVPLHQLESPFQLQEYLKSSYANVTRDDLSHTVKPITKETAMQLVNPPIQQDTGEPVDRNLWLYELCRFLVQRTNRLIVSFFADNPPCSNQTCPEMRASEWQYLCAVHEPPKSCCAIDYCCHTLDWAANVLTSTKHFPSRLSLGGEGGSAYQSMRQLTNIFRRVYRIYAHAWFQHREAFWMLEQEEGLYRFFRTVCDAYSLIPEDNYTIPHEAEGDREELETPITARPDMHILRNDTALNLAQEPQPKEPEVSQPPTTPATAPTQRRHRHTPSTGTQVNPIAEGTEEEEEELSKTIQVSQQIPAEMTATSARQALGSAAKSPRSPKPDMTIPIAEPRLENVVIPEDPTPTPERHNSDPFLEQSAFPDVPAAQEALQIEPAIHEPPPTSKTPIPPLQTEVQASEAVMDSGEEVVSPGGGSIRTVDGDILSGLLAHHEDKHEETPAETPSNAIAEPEVEEKPVFATETPAQAKVDEPVPVAEKEAEKDEEMGEIKLDQISSSTEKEEDLVATETTTKEEKPAAEIEKQEKEEKSTEEKKEEKQEAKKEVEESPAGVV